MPETDNKYNKLSLLLESVTLLVLILGGILSYFFIDKYHVAALKTEAEYLTIQKEISSIELLIKEHKENLSMQLSKSMLEESESNKDLIDINRKLGALELLLKDQKDTLEIEGKELQNQLYRLEVDLNKIGNRLSLHEKKLNISAETLEVAQNLTPCCVFNYDFKESGPFGNSNKIVHNLTNTGKYTIKLIRYEYFVSTEPVIKGKMSDSVKTTIVEGIDYIINDEVYFSGFLPPGSSKPFQLSITFRESVKIKFNKFYVTCFIYVQTHPSIVKKIQDSVKDIFTDEEIESISTLGIRSATEINFKK